MSKKNAYLELIKAQLDEWNADIDKMTAKARKAKAGMQIKIEEQIEQQIELLKQKRDLAKQKMTAIQNASDDKWENLKQGVDDAVKSLKDSFAKVRSKLEGKEK